MNVLSKCSWVLLLVVFSMSALSAQLVQDNVILLTRPDNGQQNQHQDQRQKSLDGVVIFPNPTTDYITIQMPKTSDAAVVVQVCNDKGILCMQRKITTANSTLDVSTLPTGRYYLRLISSSSVIMKPFTKQ